MYRDAFDYHLYGILVLPVIIVLFYLYSTLEKDFLRYKKRIRLWMPVYVFALSSAVFTGIVMMAAKHLNFNLPNTLMIVASLLLIYLEVIRHKRLLRSTAQEAQAYLLMAKRIYSIEMLILFATIYLSKVL